MAEAITEGQWKCEHCATLNGNQVYKCQQCSTRRPYRLQYCSEFMEHLERHLLSDEQEAHSFQGPSSSRQRSDQDNPLRTRSRYVGTEHGGYWEQSSDNEEELDFPTEECRLVLLGKTGSGKSSTGNSVLGCEKFAVGHGSKSTTTKSWWMYGNRFGIPIEIVDTPGSFDTHMDDEVVSKEIVKSVGAMSPGPHALLFVARVDVRFTEEEASAAEHVRSLFGDDVMRHAIVVFTHGDHFSRHGSFQQYLKDAPRALAKLLEDTDNRYVLFNNIEVNSVKRRKQVRQLLLTIRDMLAYKNGEHFKNPILVRCQETCLANAGELASKLEGTIPRESARQLISAALMGAENMERVLNEVLDDQKRESQIMTVVLAQKTKTIEALTRVLEEVTKKNKEFYEALQKEKASWKCTIL